jgi:hypothetical protein
LLLSPLFIPHPDDSLRVLASRSTLYTWLAAGTVQITLDAIGPTSLTMAVMANASGFFDGRHEAAGCMMGNSIPAL